MNSHHLIATIADEWSVTPPDRAAYPTPADHCRLCAGSDLVSRRLVSAWPHAALHRLVAPIEEVLAAEVENYLAIAPDREQGLYLVDNYRSRMRASARAAVDRALERGRDLGLAAS